MIGSFFQTSTEVSTPLTANKSKKKDIRNFFSAKGKPDLHLEETTLIEVDSE